MLEKMLKGFCYWQCWNRY